MKRYHIKLHKIGAKDNEFCFPFMGALYKDKEKAEAEAQKMRNDAYYVKYYDKIFVEETDANVPYYIRLWWYDGDGNPDPHYNDMQIYAKNKADAAKKAHEIVERSNDDEFGWYESFEFINRPNLKKLITNEGNY